MKKVFRKEVIIGLSVIAALGILVFGINYLKGVNVFKASNYYYAVYDNVEGLAVSAPVTLNGFKVGQVRDIRYEFNNPGHVSVEMSLDKALRIPSGSKALLGADLLGTASISLQLNNEAASVHAVGDTIESGSAKGLMSGLTENVIPSVETIFPKLDSLLSGLNAIVADPALKASVGRLDAISADLAVASQRLASTMNSLAPVVADVKNITTNVDSLTGDLAEVSHRLNQAEIDSLLANLGTTSANLAALSAQLNDPESSIGKLTRDPELYDNINSTVSSLDSLFVDIKRNPKRYVTIKVF